MTDQVDDGSDFVPTPEDTTVELPEKQNSASKDDDIDADTLKAIAGDEPKPPRTVPHKRFNEVNEEAKELRRQLKELQEQSAKKAEPAKQTESYNFDAAEDAYNAAILDGDMTKAKQLRAEIRKNEAAEAEARADARAEKKWQENTAKAEMARAEKEKDAALDEAYEAYPFLDHENEDANIDAIEEALALANLYVSKGKSIGEALRAATKKVGERYAPKAEPAKPEAKGLDLAGQVARAAKVPPQLKGNGAASTKIDVSKLTRQDIKKMSAEEKARLQGDFVE